jgi:hypothetical protein
LLKGRVKGGVIPCVCFCEPLANFLQIQKHHRATNREQRIVSQCCHLMRVFL